MEIPFHWKSKTGSVIWPEPEGLELIAEWLGSRPLVSVIVPQSGRVAQSDRIQHSPAQF